MLNAALSLVVCRVTSFIYFLCITFVLSVKIMIIYTIISELGTAGSEDGKRPYNNVPFTNCGSVLAMLQSGSEDLARSLTAYNRDLCDAGLLEKPLVVTAGKIESAIKKDGQKQIEGFLKKTWKVNS